MSQNCFGSWGFAPDRALEYKFSNRFAMGKPGKSSLKVTEGGDNRGRMRGWEEGKGRQNRGREKVNLTLTVLAT